MFKSDGLRRHSFQSLGQLEKPCASQTTLIFAHSKA